MSKQSQIVAFQLTCPEPRAWLVLTSDNQKPRVVEMRQGDAVIKTAFPELIPDEYCCRYYCGDDRTVNYHGPAPTVGSIDRGMDALLLVRVPNENWSAQLVQ